MAIDLSSQLGLLSRPDDALARALGARELLASSVRALEEAPPLAAWEELRP
ncbi:MAG: hypothetical protein AB7N76_10395 [Planctomycetota bacterium]